MGALGRAYPSLGMTPTFREYDLWSQKTQILKSRCHTKRRMGAHGHAHPSFSMTPHGHAHPSFSMTPTSQEYNLWYWQSQILKSRCHTKRRMGASTRVHPSFGMTKTKTLRSGFLWRESCLHQVPSIWIALIRATKVLLDISVHYYCSQGYSEINHSLIGMGLRN